MESSPYNQRRFEMKQLSINLNGNGIFGDIWAYECDCVRYNMHIHNPFGIEKGLFERASVCWMSRNKHYRNLSRQVHQMDDYLMIEITTGRRLMLSDFAPEADIRGWAICTG
jgi:hypothetical protein